LAYVYRPGKSGLASVNYALVATGYARAYPGSCSSAVGMRPRRRP